MRRRLILAALLALGATPAAAQDSGTAAAPDPAACEVRDVNGMITVVVCPPGLNAVGWQAAGRIACADRQPCLAWIWDDAEKAPETAPETSEGLGGEAIVSAVGVWVNDDRQFIPMQQPYVGVGADESLGEDSMDPPGLPPLDMAPAD